MRQVASGSADGRERDAGGANRAFVDNVAAVRAEEALFLGLGEGETVSLGVPDGNTVRQSPEEKRRRTVSIMLRATLSFGLFPAPLRYCQRNGQPVKPPRQTVEQSAIATAKNHHN